MSTEMRRWNEPVITDWHQQAVCRTREVSPQVWRLFDPVGLDEPKQAAWDRARLARDHFCAVCPVVAQCKVEGAEHDYEGLWGGEFRERRGIVDLDTGLVVRGDLVEVDPDELDFDALDDDAEDDEPVELEVAEAPAPPVEELAPLVEVVEPAPARAAPPTRRHRFGLRRPRRHREPSIGVQLALTDVPGLGVPRRRAVPRRVIHEPAAETRVAV